MDWISIQPRAITRRRRFNRLFVIKMRSKGDAKRFVLTLERRRGRRFLSDLLWVDLWMHAEEMRSVVSLLSDQHYREPCEQLGPYTTPTIDRSRKQKPWSRLWTQAPLFITHIHIIDLPLFIYKPLTREDPSLLPQTRPHISSTFLPKLFQIFPPHSRGLDICRTFVVRTAEHADDAQEYCFGGLNGWPALWGWFVAVGIVGWRVEDGDADFAGGGVDYSDRRY